jgi:hypothetical protein
LTLWLREQIIVSFFCEPRTYEVMTMLGLLVWFIGYRFHDYLKPKLRLPPLTPSSLTISDIKEKSRASCTTAGIFLAFSAGFLVALLSPELKSVLWPITVLNPLIASFAAVTTLFAFLIVREPRRISAGRPEALKHRPPEKNDDDMTADEEKEMKRIRRRHTWHLSLLFLLLLAVFVFPFVCPNIRAAAVMGFTLAGFFLILASLILLLLSVEFYDTAAGWQANDIIEYRFHTASIASHCYLVGLGLGMVGVSLLFCSLRAKLGCIMAAGVLIVMWSMNQIELTLSDRRPEKA